jgi:hypothetical protein
MSHLISSAYGGYSFVDERGTLAADAAPGSSLDSAGSGDRSSAADLDRRGRRRDLPGVRRAARGGFVSFEADLRMVYTCPECQETGLDTRRVSIRSSTLDL